MKKPPYTKIKSNNLKIGDQLFVANYNKLTIYLVVIATISSDNILCDFEPNPYNIRALYFDDSFLVLDNQQQWSRVTNQGFFLSYHEAL